MVKNQPLQISNRKLWNQHIHAINFQVILINENFRLKKDFTVQKVIKIIKT
jgi:hypothetical protein